MKIIFYLAVSGLSRLSGLVITKNVFNPLEQLRSQEEADIMDKWAAQSVEALFEPVKQSEKFELGRLSIPRIEGLRRLRFDES